MRGSKTQNPAPGHHSEREWQQKFFGCAMRCFYCNEPLTLKTATRDHRTPLCRGGSDEIWNIVPACLPCNQKKGWRTVNEFLEKRSSIAKHVRRNSQPLAGALKPISRVSLEEKADERGLLKKIVSEREQVSWAWRNPVA
jgi:hypothetical protein